MALQEYEIADPNFGTTTFQWDKDRDPEGFPKGAKLVKRGNVEVDGTAEGADPAPVADSQEDEAAKAKAAEDEAAKAKAAEDEAAKAAADKANKAAAAPANK